MSYSDILLQVDEEFKQKRRRAEYITQANLKVIMDQYPDIDEADSALRRTMRDFGFNCASEKDVLSVKKALKELYVKHNIPDEMIQPHYECALCLDTGKTSSGKCKCYMQRLYSLLYSESNMDTSQCFENFNLELFSEEIPKGQKAPLRQTMSNILRLCSDYAASFPKCEKTTLLFLGSTGVGKTFLANCISKAVLDKGHTVLSTSSFGLFERLTDRLNGKDVDLNHIREADLLFIDDLGMEPTLNNFTIEYLFEILNLRIKRFRSTILTSNLSPNEIRERYTERISSRLFDKQNSAVVYIPGSDLRLKNRY